MDIDSDEKDWREMEGSSLVLWRAYLPPRLEAPLILTLWDSSEPDPRTLGKF